MMSRKTKLNDLGCRTNQQLSVEVELFFLNTEQDFIDQLKHLAPIRRPASVRVRSSGNPSLL